MAHMEITGSIPTSAVHLIIIVTDVAIEEIKEVENVSWMEEETLSSWVARHFCGGKSTIVTKNGSAR